MDALIQALARTEWVVGAAVAILILGVVALLNQWLHFWISFTVHQELLAAEKSRADEARRDADETKADAEAKITHMREAMERRISELRADGADRMATSERIFDRMIAEANRRGDDFKAYAHITAENAKISEDRMDEVLEYVHLSERVLSSLREYVQHQQHRQLSRSIDGD